jgi:cytosine/adenosine deaminase-related metal-dependent hydrolase
MRTLIRASHIIALQDGEHRHLRDGVIVVDGNEVIHVGKTFDGTADREIDATGMVVTPGLINTHTHLYESPLDKSFVEDKGPRQFYGSGLFEYLPARSAASDESGARACLAFSMAELIRSGTTTVLELGSHGDRAAELAEQAGLRAYIAQGYRDGRWFTRDGRRAEWEWNHEAGQESFHKAVEFIDRVNGKANDRIRGFLSPMQIDTCSEELLKQSKAMARELDVPLTLHASQSVVEFNEMTRRHGLTPIEWLNEIGFLGPEVILGHAIILGGGTWANYPADDIGILADTGTSVAHAVWVFARRGIAMESFSRYQDRGVNMTIATDTCPQSMLEALRYAAVVSKIMDRSTELATAADVFNAATLGGAKALGRDDLGRIAPGAKADLIFWAGQSLWMTPLRDPVRNIVYNASHEDIRHVMIDGEMVMQDRKLANIDEEQVAADLQAAGERMWSRLPEGDWNHRTVDQLSPNAYKPFEG